VEESTDTQTWELLLAFAQELKRLNRRYGVHSNHYVKVSVGCKSTEFFAVE
jgi:hypothetical protein